MFRVLFAPIIRITTAAYSHRFCICISGFSIKWCEVYFVWICVYSFFNVSCDIYVLVCVCVCVLLDLFWYCVVMMCGFLAGSFCAMFVYLRFGYQDVRNHKHQKLL
jgi:uncharacterized membrane protein YdjX (TVP38/TMEM64 family)